MSAIRGKYEVLKHVLNERQVRLWAAAEARSLGRGGQAAVTEATGIHGPRIRAGLKDLEEVRRSPPDAPAMEQRVRRAGAGRKSVLDHDENLWDDLDTLVSLETRGDPMCALRWTSKSLVHLAESLTAQGHKVSPNTVGKLLRKMGFSLQAPSKTREGKQHPDRDGQFRYLAKQVKKLQAAGQPVISVDTKKKELIGAFDNGGQEWRPGGDPERVGVHDFKDHELGKVAPYGVYDVGRNEGWVSVGISGDTAEFAVETIRRWWRHMGKKAYPKATEVLITADAGGSNGARVRLWKLELQRLANDTGLTMRVCHYPPGTSKWNKIEHRLFSMITMNWRGRPLYSVQTVVQLIAATTSSTGLRVRAKVDTNGYETGTKVTKEDFASINLVPARFHGDWNYAIMPQR